MRLGGAAARTFRVTVDALRPPVALPTGVAGGARGNGINPGNEFPGPPGVAEPPRARVGRIAGDGDHVCPGPSYKQVPFAPPWSMGDGSVPDPVGVASIGGGAAWQGDRRRPGGAMVQWRVGRRGGGATGSLRRGRA